jgi:PAS domain S-box-containing protein
LVFGVDASSVSYHDEAIRTATDTGNPITTELFPLTQEQGAQRGFVMVMPVYRLGAALKNVASRRAAVIGYTAAVFRTGHLAQNILGRTGLLDGKSLDIRVYSGDAPNDRMLAFHKAAAHVAWEGPAMLPQWLTDRRPASIARTFEAGGGQWHMVVSTPPDMVRGSHTGSWLALVTGSLITLLVAAYLQALSRRAAELAHANALLTADIAARKKIERALAESEERFHRLADMSSDWYWEQDAEFRFTMINGNRTATDLPIKEFIGKTRWDLPTRATSEEWARHRRLMESHQPLTDLEYGLIDRNDQTHWIVINGEPLFDANGVFCGYRGTAKDITERKQTEQALRQSQQELRELAAYQERIREDERKRIAREIHDDLGQNLLALRIDVTLLEAHAADVSPALHQKVCLALTQIDTTVKSVRAIINNLRPPVLDLGLQTAIEWLVQQFRERSSIACNLRILGEKLNLAPDDERATAIFRVVQEALANVARHAQATRVDITLQRTDGKLTITVADNGIGVFPGNARKPRSFGLIGIKERILSLGGDFNVDSIPGQGTRLTLSLADEEPVLQACIGMQ